MPGDPQTMRLMQMCLSGTASDAERAELATVFGRRGCSVSCWNTPTTMRCSRCRPAERLLPLHAQRHVARGAGTALEHHAVAAAGAAAPWRIWTYEAPAVVLGVRTRTPGMTTRYSARCTVSPASSARKRRWRGALQALDGECVRGAACRPPWVRGGLIDSFPRALGEPMPWCCSSMA